MGYKFSFNILEEKFRKKETTLHRRILVESVLTDLDMLSPSVQFILEKKLLNQIHHYLGVNYKEIIAFLYMTGRSLGLL